MKQKRPHLPNLYPKEVPDGIYIYAIKVSNIIRYIGKGRRRRAWHHLRIAHERIDRQASGLSNKRSYFYHHLENAIKSNKKITISIIKCLKTDKAAWFFEKKEIKRLGRKIIGTGQLWNQSSGGDGQSTEDSILSHSSEETKSKQRIAALAQWQNKKVRMKMIAAAKKQSHPSEKQKKQISKTLKSKWLNDSAFASRMIEIRRRRIECGA